MKVREHFEYDDISYEFVEENLEGDYGDSCVDFLIGAWDREYDHLYSEEADLVTEIIKVCVEKRNELENKNESG